LFSASFISIQLSPPASRFRLAAMTVTATRGSATTEAEAVARLINMARAPRLLIIPALLTFSLDIKKYLKLRPALRL
jgi:hypothetical protein